MPKYKSVNNELVTSEYREKGSKFIGYIKVVKSSNEALDFVRTLKEEHPQAVHVCFAYKIGIGNNETHRYSDDGEPSNSAGAPIFGQIKSFDLTNIVIAVVRYYGGVNLGVGGLINAYRTAAKEVVDQAKVVTKEQTFQYKLDFEYSDMALLMDDVKKEKINICEQHFESDCYLIVDVNEGEIDFLKQLEVKYQTLKLNKLG